jgi:4-hydroxy-tetrahydrodipicolinate synthase
LNLTPPVWTGFFVSVSGYTGDKTMEIEQLGLRGIWLPLITPFNDGLVDEISLRRLVKHYIGEPIDGIILCATTGECLVLSDEEIRAIVSVTADEIAAGEKPLPLYLGLSGSDTRKIVQAGQNTASWPIDGYLIACPYYTRPSQEGLFQHFSNIANSTDRPILIYNIPYRTGVNLGNETMLRLAELPNIVGVKDCSGDPIQSCELLQQRPPKFAILTGEDALFYSALTHGADGGILASAHVRTREFANIRVALINGDLRSALGSWHRLVGLPELLFAEPTPAPIKHWLWRVGLIDSPELHLPMTSISDQLARRIDQELECMEC